MAKADPTIADVDERFINYAKARIIELNDQIEEKRALHYMWKEMRKRHDGMFGGRFDHYAGRQKHALGEQVAECNDERDFLYQSLQMMGVSGLPLLT